MNAAKKLSKVLSESSEIPFNNKSKIVIMSDLHRGDGSWSDDFLKNKNIVFRALSYYHDNDYTYIELGDGDELWENKNIEDIVEEHKDIFGLLRKFIGKNQLYMIYGNHDMCKKDYHLNKDKNVKSFYKITNKYDILTNEMKIHNGLILKDRESDNRIFLIHGHQGALINDKLWRLSRFMVRHFWRKLELFGINNPTNTAKNYMAKTKVEEKINKWSRTNKQMIIAGHTHRPSFPKPGESLYFNDGSCIHPHGITAIEINEGEISLVKWQIKTYENGFLYVGKDILEGPIKLEEYFKIKRPLT